MFGLWDYISHFTRKFFHDALPVALAGAFATLLLGQFGWRETATQPAAVRSDEGGQKVRDAHSAVSDEIKREANVKRDADAEQARAFKAEQERAEQRKVEQAKIEQAKAAQLAREEARKEEARKLAARKDADAKLAAEKAAEEKRAAEANRLDLEQVAKAIAAPAPAPQVAPPSVAVNTVATPVPAVVPQLPPPVAVATRTIPAPVSQPAEPLPLQARAVSTESKRDERSGVGGAVREIAVSAKQAASRAWDRVFDDSAPPVPPAPIPAGRFSGS